MVSLAPLDVARLRESAAARGVTPMMVLFAALHGLVGRLAQTDDPVVGLVVANRSKPADLSSIGCYSDLRYIHAHIDQNDTFEQHLMRVSEKCFETLQTTNPPRNTVLRLLADGQLLGTEPNWVVFNGYSRSSNVSSAARLNPGLFASVPSAIRHPAQLDPGVHPTAAHYEEPRWASTAVVHVRAERAARDTLALSVTGSFHQPAGQRFPRNVRVISKAEHSRSRFACVDGQVGHVRLGTNHDDAFRGGHISEAHDRSSNKDAR